MSAKYPFLNRWFVGFNDDTSFEKHVDSFIEQFDDTQQEVILKMLAKYTYINPIQKEQLFNDYLNKLYDFIISLNIVGNYFITTPIRDGEPHNSDLFSIIFKGNNHFDKYLTRQKLETCDYLFVVDDYSGTGNTIKKYIDKLSEHLKSECIIYVIPVFFTSEAKFALQQDGFNLNLNITIEKQSKYYSTHSVITPEEKKIFDIASLKKARVRFKFLNGYEDTEDLFSFSYATPNNTFGLFWDDENTLYIPLFCRQCDQLFSIQQRRFKHELLRAANDMLVDSKLEEIDEKKRFSIYIPILLKTGYSENEIKKMLRLNSFGYHINFDIMKERGVINDDGTINDAVFQEYVDIDKYNLFLGMGIKPTGEKQFGVANSLASLIQWCKES